ncbi:MAG: glutamine amidotransferase [Candidatus Hinthialibacteria bacterium]|nr:aminodeoxychorismate/anthranilate synthase component II [bacterium]
MVRIFILDNYDSFTFNLVQYLGELGAQLEVARNDRITVDEIRALQPDGIVISPGPCTPNEAGISLDLIGQLGSQFPILGVCLGHQCIGQCFGGSVVRANEIMHGKVSEITHDDSDLFKGVENPFTATRYHSLVVDREGLPECLEVNAWTRDGTIMGLRHLEYPIYGVQFHPESILTTVGKKILSNFLEKTGAACRT